ncbi:hypothetical protein DPMN_016323 [Dreissena polymorpha]|uniref:Uncharacterized protein n=1 Tax=Dreissena polymorpha TaxID=45954 RepID=A0A9D4NED6_DREPO|nr:hypothetical protein DPMN_016323 [Dreissena polymorpha]
MATALTVVEKNIQDTFSENGNHPLVKLVANEKLKSAYKKNKRLVSSYTESVLVKEACSVIMQEQIDVKPGEHKDANILQKSSTWLTTPYGRKMCKDKSDELPKQNGTKRNKIQKEYNKAGVTALERSMLTTGQVKQLHCEFLVLPFLINRHIRILDKNSDYWLHIQPNFWVLRWWGVTCFRPESCRTIQLQGHLT